MVSVIAVARSIGLVSDARGEVSGTIDQNVVLVAISGLASAHPGDVDLSAINIGLREAKRLADTPA